MCLFIRENPARGGSREGHVLARLPWKLFIFIELFICTVPLRLSRLMVVTDKTLGQGGHEPLHTWAALPESRLMTGPNRELGSETLASLPS